MNFPHEAVIACDTLAQRHSDLAHSSDDNDRRKLTRMICEQIAYDLGNDWGCKKRAGLSDEFQSKDSIAYREDDNTTSVWDWQNGTTRERGVNEGDEPHHSHLDDSEATFMPVEKVNHLERQKPTAVVVGNVIGEIPPPVEVQGLTKAFDDYNRDTRGCWDRVEAILNSRPGLVAPVGTVTLALLAEQGAAHQAQLLEFQKWFSVISDNLIALSKRLDGISAGVHRIDKVNMPKLLELVK